MESPLAAPARPLLGIFVGGKAKRFGGRDKSALRAASGETLLERHLAVASALSLEPVLVGDRGGSGAAGDCLKRVRDEPSGIGPLGGLQGLLTHGRGRTVVAIACDMPLLDAELVRALLVAPKADIVAPREPMSGKWRPFLARYNADACAPGVRAAIGDGVRSFQRLFKRLGAEELLLSDAQQQRLVDWDSPDDLP